MVSHTDVGSMFLVFADTQSSHMGECMCQEGASVLYRQSGESWLMCLSTPRRCVPAHT